MNYKMGLPMDAPFFILLLPNLPKKEHLRGARSIHNIYNCPDEEILNLQHIGHAMA